MIRTRRIAESVVRDHDERSLTGVVVPVADARVAHEPVYLTRRGRRVAAVVDAAYLDWLIEFAEDYADVQAAQAARDEMAETGEAALPWEQVKADLGLA